MPPPIGADLVRSGARGGEQLRGGELVVAEQVSATRSGKPEAAISSNIIKFIRTPPDVDPQVRGTVWQSGRSVTNVSDGLDAPLP